MVAGKIEELQGLPQVDVLVSEPMGTLLVNERMLETYLYARDHFLKPGGRMFPVRCSCLTQSIDQHEHGCPVIGEHMLRTYLHA